ncbi:hypothetical protein AKO1_010912 [Acrasis kona]|uniref:Uncharacterized protein n=1 Tax=Acrasis kona TaxID=1008807 RepID=A0AAW2YSF3_9EUKA
MSLDTTAPNSTKIATRALKNLTLEQVANVTKVILCTPASKKSAKVPNAPKKSRANHRRLDEKDLESVRRKLLF